MSKRSRKEIIKYYESQDMISAEELEFYYLPHEKKVDPQIFEEFCIKYSGHMAIVLSDDQICDNKELVKIAKNNRMWSDFHLLSSRLLSDREMALILAECNHREYRNISKELRNDANLMLEAIKINPSIYPELPFKVKMDRRIVLEIAETEPYQLYELLKVKKNGKEALQNDKEIALILAHTNPRVLNDFCSQEILNDKDILETVFHIADIDDCKIRLLKWTWGFRYVDPKWWVDDRTLIKSALHEDGELLRILPEKYQGDKELVKVAVKNCPEVFMFCGEDIRDDKKIALLAVKQCPEMIEFSSDRLKDDEDIVKAALQDETEGILEFVSERLRADYQIVLRAVKVDALNLEYASESLKDDDIIVMTAIKNYGGALEDASERLRNDERFIKVAEMNM